MAMIGCRSFLKSNGSETFTHDWLAGDVVVHSTDSTSGIGNGLSNLLWTSPFNGFVDISGNTWLGRDLGRSNRWNIYHGTTLLSSGDTTTGDPYSRATPFAFSAGSGGAASLLHVPVTIGDTLRLEIVALSGASGDFQGLNFTITPVPEPGSLALGLIGASGFWFVRGRGRTFR